MPSISTGIHIQSDLWHQFEQAAKAAGIVTTNRDGEVRGNVSRWLTNLGRAEIERREQDPERGQENRKEVGVA